MVWSSGCGENELQNLSSETSKCIKFSVGLAVTVKIIVLWLPKEKAGSISWLPRNYYKIKISSIGSWQLTISLNSEQSMNLFKLPFCRFHRITEELRHNLSFLRFLDHTLKIVLCLHKLSSFSLLCVLPENFISEYFTKYNSAAVLS